MKTKVLMCLIPGMLCILILSGCTMYQSERDQSDSMVSSMASTQTSLPNSSESVDMALEQAVSDAILSHNRGSFRGDDKQMFTTEYHEILKTVVQDNSTEVYLVALYAQYQFEEGEAKLTGSGSNPCIITFVSADGVYSATDYWEPEDGENYENSLRSRFPEDVLESGTELSEPNAMEICNQRAMDYFEGQGADSSKPSA